mmetsp:Transcript_10579/g.15571  ORF Transcript_10579/g.15571 Transcript_10579/m.15571 type:complete len:474 (+) Transcript_10579:16-1437(+)
MRRRRVHDTPREAFGNIATAEESREDRSSLKEHLAEEVMSPISFYTCLVLFVSSGAFLLWHFSPVGIHVLQSAVKNTTIYSIPHALPNVGDKSLRYQIIRFFYDLRQDNIPSLEKVKEINRKKYEPISIPKNASLLYDIYKCPLIPPKNYPHTWNVLDIVTHWPLEDTYFRKEQQTIHQGLCVFDYRLDYDKAKQYRSLELPFIIRNDPEVARTVVRWNYDGYLSQLLGNAPHRTEVSNESTYMYWVHPELARRRLANDKMKGYSYNAPKNWKPPTEMMKMTYDDWVLIANSSKGKDQHIHDYYYFQISGCGGGICEEGSTEFLFDELVFFQPNKDNLYLVQPEKQKGIHCRFGMPGLSIAAHFDGSRNTIVVLSGSRRYLLAHPRECSKLGLYPIDHPSARHSRLKWTNGTLDGSWRKARLSEVVLQAGDVLYLPAHWFHLIVSLDVNVQCNTRSGIGSRHSKTIRECGFPS